MASIIDEMMCREGGIDPDFQGINQAKAGDMMWYRERGEGEAEFLARARRDAALSGYKLVCVSGHLAVGDAHHFTRSDCERLGRGWKA